jgi:hypothetical protein
MQTVDLTFSFGKTKRISDMTKSECQEVLEKTKGKEYPKWFQDSLLAVQQRLDSFN